ncbi:hypothetical protein GCM10007096_37600 [Pullulanibacillus pueri]|uniref:Uncharacterized protein n=1 Tax=Pullulanibacillus pueri TaxID=1437324 RepID=A0A8J2ZZV1_9BACL|nr:hypothetical protein GCM10007096_37600 [Pullulanibacillus pueri]
MCFDKIPESIDSAIEPAPIKAILFILNYPLLILSLKNSTPSFIKRTEWSFRFRGTTLIDV